MWLCNRVQSFLQTVTVYALTINMNPAELRLFSHTVYLNCVLNSKWGYQCSTSGSRRGQHELAILPRTWVWCVGKHLNTTCFPGHAWSPLDCFSHFCKHCVYPEPVQVQDPHGSDQHTSRRRHEVDWMNGCLNMTDWQRFLAFRFTEMLVLHIEVTECNID